MPFAPPVPRRRAPAPPTAARASPPTHHRVRVAVPVREAEPRETAATVARRRCPGRLPLSRHRRRGDAGSSRTRSGRPRPRPRSAPVPGTQRILQLLSLGALTSAAVAYAPYLGTAAVVTFVLLLPHRLGDPAAARPPTADPRPAPLVRRPEDHPGDADLPAARVVRRAGARAGRRSGGSGDVLGGYLLRRSPCRRGCAGGCGLHRRALVGAGIRAPARGHPRRW